MVGVKVKWNKQEFDVDVDLGGKGIDFKAQLMSLTGVPADRQKITLAGKSIKDDDSLNDPKLKIKEGAKFLLMGSADVVEKPKEATVFIEDLPREALAKQMLPSGLANLGNTCYLNSTLQALRAVPQYREALTNLPGESSGSDEDKAVTTGLHRLFAIMDSTPDAVPPLAFVALFRRAFPQFDQQEQGRHMQQDAEEAFTQIQGSTARALGAIGKSENAVDTLFGGALEAKYTCVETENEPTEVKEETFRKLQCYISQNSTTLEAGLAEAMGEKIQKNSEILGREAVWQKEARLVALPEYLVVQMVRFEWRRDINKKTKQLRAVQFPFTLDLFQMCSEGLKGNLERGRNILRKRADKELEKKRKERQRNNKAEAAETPQTEAMDVDEDPADAEFLNTLGNKSAFYELFAIVTHKGRDAEGGHYVSWVKPQEQWLMFDDDKVTEKTEDDIRKTAGGAGDWHLAYILFYRTRTAKGVVCGPP